MFENFIYKTHFFFLFKKCDSSSIIVKAAKVLNTAYFPTEITNSSYFGKNEIWEFAKVSNILIDRVMENEGTYAL